MCSTSFMYDSESPAMYLKSLETKYNVIDKQVFEENKTEVERYKAGDKQLTGFFMGKLMKVSNGKADPKIANSLLQQMLNT